MWPRRRATRVGWALLRALPLAAVFLLVERGVAHAEPDPTPAPEPVEEAAGEAPDADAAPEQHEEDPNVAAARQHYAEGVKLVRQVQWADALAAFEESYRLRPHPTTMFNIGACARALGRYTLARDRLRRALSENEVEGRPMPPALVADAEAYLTEADAAIVRVAVTLKPADAAFAVDGRPLMVESGRDGGTTLIAGMLPPGPGKAPPAAAFDVVIDPGTHVFTITREGHTPAMVNRTFAPGTHHRLPIEIEKLPATLQVTSNQPDAIVRIGELDVGPTPVEVLRPAGAYDVTVSKEGFVTYATQVTVHAGQPTKLRATLEPEETSIVEQWWFWTGAAAVVAGGVVLTYALTRPDPGTAPYDGGNTGWVLQPTVATFSFP